MLKTMRKAASEPATRNAELEEELASVEKMDEPSTPAKDQPIQFPQYFHSAPGAHDITAKQIADWLKQELLADRISPLSLDLIGKNAVTLAYRYWAKGGTKRRAKPNMDLSWRSRAPGD